ncbi:SAM-dependent methyltransferase [Chromobacterium alkanivorans]|uniref:class I SAM-dependent methyltransferase n=1 Tax=Chromobacterium alkanivorans TaxID=1071719 RepID=UPI001967E990|nr:class I SAM-dependent methyltransferase [Chromobacterium alkanivorans]MBN3006628.1 class I SAM-dependent methyltransferase [Chromobacterium alkanivorans]MCS3806848.1 SAM-dependent methyltransferase [Chromobacterium alkanivorans]MCS3821184.1 SAM-dependent methyltransferase [Chromobacterium alkanivorans]MCS3876185.1 SAM-dependent methyltransferase [Chromobacterium alkanivorans]
MTQNIYDNPDFFHGYSQLGRSTEGLAGAAEWPVLQAMLPAIAGKDVLDLGCGYGWFCRWAREQNAADVLGLDVSEKMLATAAQMTADKSIRYARADLDALDPAALGLADASRDLVYSSLTFHYLKDLAGLLRAARRVLRADGRLVFSIEHPIYMASRQPGWLHDAQGRKSWPVDSYQMEGERVTHWLADGVVKQHRTLGTLLNLTLAAGFQLCHVEDWGPSDAQIAARPELAEERERPMLLLVSARCG